MRHGMAEESPARVRLVQRLVGVVLMGILCLATSSVTWALIHRYRSPAELLVVEPEVARVSAKEKGQEQPVEFALTNRGRKPITIRGVSSNCGCVAVGAYEGTVLAPGETLALRFLVRVPEYGVSRTRLEVIHDRDSTPVEMYVEAAGSQ